MRRLLTFLALFGFLCAPAAPASAQSAIGGIVKDANGRVVAGARVTVKDLVTQREQRTVSSPIGHYEVAKLLPGPYVVTVESEFYEPFVGQVDLVKHIMARLDVALIIRHRERITVRGDAASTRPLASADFAGATFSRAAIESMPLPNGRTVQSMLALVPGIVFTDSVGTLAQFTAMGQRRFANRMTIDGVSADLALDVRGRGIGEAASGALPALATSGGTQTLVPLEAIEEIQVRTMNAVSSEARSPGAQTSIVTRSGGDRLAATAFGMLRPNAWAASDWFANAGQAPDRENSITNAGASVGGPLAKQWHYFVAAETQALNRAVSTTIEVPSIAARAAATSLLRQVLDAFPVPNGPEVGSGLAEYSARFPVGSRLWTVSGRVDSTLSTRHRVFARVNVGDSSGDALGSGPYQRPLLAYSSREAASTRTATAGWRWLGAASINELRGNVSGQTGSVENGVARHGGARAVAVDELTPNLAAHAASFFVVFPGPSGVVAEGPIQANEHTQVQLSDTLTVAAGTHQWKMGLEYGRVVTSSRPASQFNTFRFGGVGRLLQGAPAQATLMATTPAEVIREAGAAFVQDTWRVSSKLTVDYGVRYSVAPAPVGRNGTQPLLLDFAALPERRILPSGSRLWRTAWDAVAPRVGTALAHFAL